MDEVKNRHFHALSLQSDHSDLLLQHKETVDRSIKNLYVDMQETEIKFHGRPVVVNMDQNFVDTNDTNVAPLYPAILRKDKHDKSRPGGRDSSRVPGRAAAASDRYYMLRREESNSERRFANALEQHGSKAAKAHLDEQHMFARMYRDATAMQQASFKVRTVKRKDGMRDGSPLWAGSNEPHLGPGACGKQIFFYASFCVFVCFCLGMRAHGGLPRRGGKP